MQHNEQRWKCHLSICSLTFHNTLATQISSHMILLQKFNTNFFGILKYYILPSVSLPGGIGNSPEHMILPTFSIVLKRPCDLSSYFQNHTMILWYSQNNHDNLLVVLGWWGVRVCRLSILLVTSVTVPTTDVVEKGTEALRQTATIFVTFRFARRAQSGTEATESNVLEHEWGFLTITPTHLILSSYDASYHDSSVFSIYIRGGFSS